MFDEPLIEYLNMDKSHSTTTLFQTLYGELKAMAARRLASERPDHTLQATALVHEVYMRLDGGNNRQEWDDDGQFLAAATETMRRILIDHARVKLAAKRGGTRRKLPLNEQQLDLPLPPSELLAIHDGLATLEHESPTHAKLVKLRVFGGLSHKEAAIMLGLSRATADRYWAYAKLRLYSLIK